MRKILAMILVCCMLTSISIGFVKPLEVDATDSQEPTAVQPYAVNWTRQAAYPSGTESAIDNWKFRTTGAVKSSPAMGTDGTIYVGSDDGYVYAINPDGTRKWSFRTGSWVRSSPVIGEDGTIYVGSWNYKLYAINPDGTQKWAYNTGGLIDYAPAIGTDGTIYVVCSNNYEVRAVNPDGTLKWQFRPGSWFVEAPSIGPDGTIYAGTWDKHLYAINTDGTQKWAFSTQDYIDTAVVISQDGTAYVGDGDDILYAVGSDGREKWRKTLEYGIERNPVIGPDGTIYTAGVVLYAINPDGSVKWRSSTSESFSSGLALGRDGVIYIGSYDNGLYAFNPNGSVKWIYNEYTTFNAPGIESTPIIGANKTLYFGSDEGLIFINLSKPFLYCIESDSSNISLNEGETHQLVVQAVYSDQSRKTITSGLSFASTNVSVATVSSSGVISTVGPGNARISINFGNKSTSVSMEVRAVLENMYPDFNWTNHLDSSASRPRLTGDGSIVITSSSGYLYSYNSNGEKKWEFFAGKQATRPAVDANGIIYTGTQEENNSKLYAVDSNGNLQWSFITSSEIVGTEVGPDGTIYASTYDGVYAVDSQGHQKWFLNYDAYCSNLTVGTDGTIYFTVGQYIRAVNADGTIKWAYRNYGNDFSGSAFAVGVDGTVYAGSWDHYIYAIGSNGVYKWRYATGSIVSSVEVGPDGIIYVGSWDRSLYALNPNGTKKWQFTTLGVVEGAAVAPDGTVYVASNDYYLYAVNPNTGRERFHYYTSGYPSVPVFHSDGTIYYSCGNYVYSLVFKEPYIESVTLEPEYINLAIGGTLQTVVSAVYTDWNSYDITGKAVIHPVIPGIVNVNEGGLLTGEAEGQTIITAVYGDKSADATVVVGGYIPELRWMAEVEETINTQPAVAADGTVYVGTSDGSLVSVDNNGMVKWNNRIAVDEIYAAPILGRDGTIFVGSSDGKVYAVDEDGTTKWEFDTTDYIALSLAIGEDGVIYAGCEDGKLYAINPDGTEKWEFGAAGSIYTPAYIAKDGTIYISAGNLYALNPDGTEKWMFNPGSDAPAAARLASPAIQALSSPVAAADGTVYTAFSNGKLYALHADGTEKWSLVLIPSFFSRPSVSTDGTVSFIGIDGIVYSVSSEGIVKWAFYTGDAAFIASGTGILTNGTIVAATNDGNVYALESNGRKVWQYTSETAANISPTVSSSNTIYFSTLTGKIYAVKGRQTMDRVTLDSASYTLNIGETCQSVVAAVYSDGESKIVTGLASFQTQYPEIAVVDENGVIHALGEGETVISATYQGLTTSAVVRVRSYTSPARLEGISTNVPFYNLRAGDTLQMEVTASYSDGSSVGVTQFTQYRSQHPGIAEVDANGRITGIHEGQTVITATYQGKTGSANITVFGVEPIVSLEGIIADTANCFLRVGQSQQVKVTGTYSDGSTKEITDLCNFTSSAPQVAEVSNTGIILGAAQGETVITVTYESQSTTITVKVASSSGSKSSTSGATPEISIYKDDQLDKKLNVSDVSVQGNRIIVETGAVGNSMKVEINGAVITSFLKSNISPVLEFKTPIGDYSLPLDGLNQSEIEKKLGTSFNNARVSLFVEKATGENVSSGRNTAHEMGAELASELISFKVEAEASGKKVELSNLKKYFSGTITLEERLNPMEITGVYYDSATQQFTFAPTVVENDGGRTTVKIKGLNNGTYGILKVAKSFEDIKDHWAKPDIENLASKLIVKGKSDDSFAPEDNVTRAEFVAMVARSLGIRDTKQGGQFTDIKNEWYAGFVTAASEAGLIKGYEDGSFKPNNTITREEIVAILSRISDFTGNSEKNVNVDAVLAKFGDKADISEWAKAGAATAAQSNIIRGDEKSNFRPKEEATRSEIAAMLYRLLRELGFIN